MPTIAVPSPRPLAVPFPGSSPPCAAPCGGSLSPARLPSPARVLALGRGSTPVPPGPDGWSLLVRRCPVSASIGLGLITKNSMGTPAGAGTDAARAAGPPALQTLEVQKNKGNAL